MAPTTCHLCGSCIENCTAPCPGNKNSCTFTRLGFANRARINRQVYMSSSQALQKRASAVVSQVVGQGGCPTHLLQGGGPGDLQEAIQQMARPNPMRCGRSCSYRVGILRRRTAYKGKKGVDRKHGSYSRYLRRRVGGVLREEKMPVVVNRTTIIKQPRNRTGTHACVNRCGIPTDSHIRTKPKCPEIEVPLVAAFAQGGTAHTVKLGLNGKYSCCSDKCCKNRIPNCCYCDQTIHLFGTGLPWTASVGDTIQQAATGATGKVISFITGLGQAKDITDIVIRADDCTALFKDGKGQPTYDLTINNNPQLGRIENHSFDIDIISTTDCPSDSSTALFTGKLGNNTQCVSSTRCSCCWKNKIAK